MSPMIDLSRPRFGACVQLGLQRPTPVGFYLLEPNLEYWWPAVRRLDAALTLQIHRYALGKSSSRGTLNILARSTYSRSVTQRTCPSIPATTSRLMSHPLRWHSAAKPAWDNPAWCLKRLTCGPTMFLFLIGTATLAGIRSMDCVKIHTTFFPADCYLGK